MELKDKVVIITGGSRGIGKSTAELFVKEGSKVIICSRNEIELRETAEEISKNFSECLPVKCDVREPNEVKNLIKEVIAKFSRIDILVNNAGTGYYKKITDTTVEEWDITMDINLKGVFLFCKGAIPFMKNGIIINISSGAGKNGFPYFSAYCASKFGLIGLTQSLAAEWPDLKVYVLCPGPVETMLFRNTSETIRAISPEQAEYLESNIKQPKDVASAIIKLCKVDYIPSGTSIDIC